jgi:hypothetical protein
MMSAMMIQVDLARDSPRRLGEAEDAGGEEVMKTRPDGELDCFLPEFSASPCLRGEKGQQKLA